MNKNYLETGFAALVGIGLLISGFLMIDTYSNDLSKMQKMAEDGADGEFDNYSRETVKAQINRVETRQSFVWGGMLLFALGMFFFIGALLKHEDLKIEEVDN